MPPSHKCVAVWAAMQTAYALHRRLPSFEVRLRNHRFASSFSQSFYKLLAPFERILGAAIIIIRSWLPWRTQVGQIQRGGWPLYLSSEEVNLSLIHI